jgi:hypothetical protein
MNPDYRVFNHGETAFVSRQGLEGLIDVINSDSSIDLAVSYDGVNDVLELCRINTSLDGHFKESDFKELLSPRSADPGLSLGEAIKTLLFRRTQQVVNRIVQGDAEDETDAEQSELLCADDPARAEAVARTLLSNWRHARELSRAEGIDFIGVLQPVAYMGAPQLDHLSGLPDSQMHPELKDQYEAVYPILRDAIADSGAGWMVDLSGAYDGEQPLYIDFCHVISKANEIIAAAISDVVDERS